MVDNGVGTISDGATAGVVTDAYSGPVFDNHFHLDPRGEGVEAVKAFHRSGGTHLMLVHKPYGHGERYNATAQDHERDFETTLKLASQAREAVPEVQVFVALGPHPAEFTTMLDNGHTMDEADAVHRAAQELAARYVREGKAVAIGEIGRPHWEGVAEEVWAAANAQMEHAFALAAELACAAIIHCETGTPAVYADLAKHCDAAGLAREKAVKHYSPPVVNEADNHGLFPSVLVGKDAAEDALAQGTRFFMETDYMDDPRYPGAVLGPKTVPKRTLHLLDAGVMTEEQAWAIHKENAERVYGIEL